MGDFCHGYGFLLLISLCLLKVLFCFLFSPKYLNSVLRYDESWEIHTIQGNTCQCFKAKISNSVNDAHATPYHMSQQLVLTNISMLFSQTNGECSSPLFIYLLLTPIMQQKTGQNEGSEGYYLENYFGRKVWVAKRGRRNSCLVRN